MLRTLIVCFVAVAAAFVSAPTSSSGQVKEEKKAEEPRKEPAGTKNPPGVGTSVKSPAEIALPGEVEINLLNGSTVRMILQSDKLDVATAFGQLSVPAKAILAIDFGLHFPDGIEAQIRQAVKGLGGNNFQERDRASKSLVELGPYSYPHVMEASLTSDLEVSRRAKEIVKQLQKKHPKKDLKSSPEDRVITANFTIVGRILNPMIKARAELFGEVDLPVSRMRGLRSLAGAGLEIEVVVDASRYATNGQWMETEFQIDGRTQVVVTAKGQVDTWPQQGGQYIVGPNGLQGRGQGIHIPIVPGRKIVGSFNSQQNGGLLIGKIGEDGEAFAIGERWEGTPEVQGKLYLHIGPSPWGAQSTGSFDVKMGRR